MEIKQDDYVLGFWMGHNVQIPADFLMTVLMRGEEWLAEYRFRYIRDEVRGVESKDEKHFFGFSLPVSKVSEEQLLRSLEQGFMPAIRLVYPDTRFREVRGNGEKFMYVMALEQDSHIQRVSREDAERLKWEGVL